MSAARARPTGEPTVHNRSTYVNRGCRCETCREANAAHSTMRRRENRAARAESEAAGRVHIVDGIQHGAAGYGFWNCRCETCRLAHNAETRTNWQRRRARAAESPP